MQVFQDSGIGFPTLSEVKLCSSFQAVRSKEQQRGVAKVDEQRVNIMLRGWCSEPNRAHPHGQLKPSQALLAQPETQELLNHATTDAAQVPPAAVDGSAVDAFVFLAKTHDQTHQPTKQHKEVARPPKKSSSNKQLRL